MRKILSLAVVVAVAVGVGVPAHAAPLSWADAAGDAGEPAAGVAPSEPTLDITKVAMSFDGKDLKYVAAIKALGGDPTASIGSYFRFYLSHEGTQFEYIVYEDKATGPGNVLNASDDATQKSLTCSGCKALVDRKSSSVIVTLPLKSLSQGMKQYQSDLKPLTPGTKLDGLEVTASRNLLLVSLVADYAPAPDNTFFTI